MLNEKLSIKGRLSIELKDENGNLKDSRDIPNLVVNVGRAFIAQSMLKTTTNTPVAMTHIGVGTGGTAAALADTTLGTEIGTRSSVTATNVTVTVTNDTAQYVATFAAGNGTGALTEAGVFNASTAGTMLCRTTFAVINKGANDTLTITWRVTVSSS
jgi:hypothetical protein